MIPAMPARCSRRAVLLACLCGAGAVISGCEASTDPDDPALPTDGAGRPIKTSAADVGLLLATLQRTRSLVDMGEEIAPFTRGSLLEQLHQAHQTQHQVLTRLLIAARVDPGPAPGVATSSPQTGGDAGAGVTDTAAPNTAAPTRSRKALAEGLAQELTEDASPAAMEAVAGAGAANLPMLIALHGQRTASAALLGATWSWPTLAGPTGPATVGLLSALRPAVYVLEVLAARTAGKERGRYEQALRPLRTLTRQVTELAAEAAPPAPLGYGLPAFADTPSARADLAAQAMRPLPAAVIDGTAALSGDLAAVTGSVRLLGEVVRLGRPFGLAITGFPGMTVP